MDSMERLCPKGVLASGWMYRKGKGFQKRVVKTVIRKGPENILNRCTYTVTANSSKYFKHLLIERVYLLYNDSGTVEQLQKLG